MYSNKKNNDKCFIYKYLQVEIISKFLQYSLNKYIDSVFGNWCYDWDTDQFVHKIICTREDSFIDRKFSNGSMRRIPPLSICKLPGGDAYYWLYVVENQ